MSEESDKGSNRVLEEVEKMVQLLAISTDLRGIAERLSDLGKSLAADHLRGFAGDILADQKLVVEAAVDPENSRLARYRANIWKDGSRKG